MRVESACRCAWDQHGRLSSVQVGDPRCFQWPRFPRRDCKDLQRNEPGCKGDFLQSSRKKERTVPARLTLPRVDRGRNPSSDKGWVAGQRGRAESPAAGTIHAPIHNHPTLGGLPRRKTGPAGVVAGPAMATRAEGAIPSPSE